MGKEMVHQKVTILGRKHTIKHEPHEEKLLQSFVTRLSESLDAFKQRYPKLDNESLLMLNSLYLMRKQKELEAQRQHIESVITAIIRQIDDDV